MNGILLIDKPEGMMSHGVVARTRRCLNTKRVGHAGTLDPMATGVLVVLVGKATKLSDYLLNKEKLYQAGILLGVETDTYDLEGRVLSEQTPSVSELELKEVLESFKGKQMQVPPMYSAIKQNGKKLYELARKGIEVERKSREIEVFSLSLLSFDGAKAVIDVHCSKGTYIRSLAYDIGKKLNCGACLFSLRRTASGQFSQEQAITIEQLEAGEATLLPTHSVFSYPSVFVEGEEEVKIRNGSPIPLQQDYHETVKVFSKTGAFLCVARAEQRPYGCYLQPEIMFLEED